LSRLLLVEDHTAFRSALAFLFDLRPGMKVVARLWFTDQQDARQQDLERQRALVTALQAYLDQMSVLLIEHDLRASDQGSEERELARARTLTVLEQLDPSRRTQVFQFLRKSQLVQGKIGVNVEDEGVVKRAPIIRLAYANLSDADVSADFPKSISRREFLRRITRPAFRVPT
jgi:hypothetical protein